MLISKVASIRRIQTLKCNHIINSKFSVKRFSTVLDLIYTLFTNLTFHYFYKKRQEFGAFGNLDR